MSDERADDPGDLPLRQLDDHRHRDELRRRYGMLLQELRVVLPGVQVLLAFLLTVPFTDGFDRLDAFGRDLVAVALASTFVAVVLLLGPPVTHRTGARTARRRRLALGIRMAAAGYAVLAVALISGLWCVARLVFGGTAGTVTAVGASLLTVVTWIVVPRRSIRLDREDEVDPRSPLSGGDDDAANG